MSNKLAFITGITGQDGSYLSELLLSKNYKVYGIVRRTSLLYSYTRIDKIRNKLNLKYGDLTDSMALSAYIHEIINTNDNFEVFEIYNLGAQSHVAISFEIPEYTSLVDGVGTLHLLEIIKSFPVNIRDRIKFYQAGTSEMFGKVKTIPQNEETPFNPVSPYAVAKVQSHYLTTIYRNAYGIYATNGILFNHGSSRRGNNFVTMKIVLGIKNILANKQDYIQLGNLESKRDWGHARDYVNGMWLMLQQTKPDDYVLATGEMYTVRSFVEKAFAYKGLIIKWKGESLREVGYDQYNNIRIRINPKYYRPCEVDLLLGDPKKAETELGWKREYNLDKLIEEMFSCSSI